jgi:hypothetical protein
MRSAKHARVGLSRGWPKEIRSDPQAVDVLTRDHQRDLVAGLLRQLRAGIRSTAGRGRLTEAVMLLEGLAHAFTDYALSVDGEIGPHHGLLEIPLSAVDAVVAASLQFGDNEAGNYALKQLVWLGEQKCHDPEYAAVRALVARRLQSYLDDSWDNDTSTVPAASVSAMGDLVLKWIGIRAFEDAAAGIEILGQIAGRSLVSRRKHIGYAATDKLASSFPFLANQQSDHLSRHYLRAWSEASAPIFRLAAAEPLDGMAGVADALLPGITLAGASSALQQTMWDVAPPRIPLAVEAILSALEPSIRSLAPDTGDGRQYEAALADSLSLAYAVSLLLARDEPQEST